MDMEKKIINDRGCIIVGTNAAQTFCKSTGCNKLNVCDWLNDTPRGINTTDLVEVRFKNTRKSFFNNINQLVLHPGDIVAVEASPGHDIGIVSLTGDLVPEQMKKYNVPFESEFKKIYRKAKPNDIEKWEQAIEREQQTMLESREIAIDLKLDMKIGDVEYQGDGTKAIFYYIADERVDFRELIKILADRFKIRVEMRQIGARQEAGRIGGIGSCGRELCCASWITNFSSVTTTSARFQELSLNPQKLAGQCGKLKCCLNYEMDCYADAQKDFPSSTTILETEEGQAHHQKTDIFKRIMWYSFDPDSTINMIPMPVERVKEVIEMNKMGKKPKKLLDKAHADIPVVEKFDDILSQDSISRFQDDKSKQKRKKRRSKKRYKK